MKRVLAAAVAALLCAATLYWLYDHGLVRFAYPDPGHYPLRGVDVSHHQREIDWSRVAHDGVRFAYAKASEGGDHRDDRFRANAAAANAAGLAVGAYHFFTLCRSGHDQARNFLAATQGAPLRLPPAVDLEYLGNCSARVSKSDFGRELRVFLAEVEGATGRQAILYATREFYDAYLEGAGFNDHTLWYRDLFGGLSAPDGERAALWQFANRGRVDGVRGPIDLNVFNGTELQFQRLSSAPKVRA